MNNLIRNIILLIILSSITLLGQNDVNPNGYNKFYYGNGKISSEGYMKNGKPDGYWRSYYVDGTLQSEGNRVNTLLDSTWVFYDTDGDTLKKINYRNGKKTGYYYTYKYIKTDTGKVGGLYSKELYINNKKEGESYYYNIITGKLDKIIPYKNGVKSGMARQIKDDTLIITLYEYRNDFLINVEKINRYNKNGQKTGVWKEFYPNNTIKTEKNYKNGKLNGYCKYFDKNGKLIKIDLYENGKLVTANVDEKTDIKEETEYYPSGKPKAKGGYLNGKPIGLHKEYSADGKIIKAKYYNENGTLVSRGQVNEYNKKIGKWEFFYKTGELKAEGNYDKNRRIGHWKFYYKDGKVEQEGDYKKGRISGEWKWYYHNGNVWRIEHYLNGKEEGDFVEYNLNGQIVSKGKYFDGKKEGEWEYITGDTKEVGSFQEGERNGMWKIYNRAGKLIFEGKYLQGLPEGVHKYYYDNGRLQEYRYYISGELNKYLKRYDEEGNLFLIEKYKNGVLVKINGKKINFPKN